MNQLFQPYLREFVLVFFDDILIYSKTWKEHMKHLEHVISLLEKNNFYAKILKCSFGKKEVEYLGHIISQKGVKVDPSKIKEITEWPKPNNISKLSGFLILIGYYRRFIKNYTQLTTPLSNLLKKKSFRWDNNAKEYFKTLKRFMSSTHVLTTPDFAKSFIIECDKSRFGLGVVLRQDGYPIAFESRKFNKRELLKSTYDKEMLAIMLSHNLYLFQRKRLREGKLA
jgi:hypothetical protein